MKLLVIGHTYVVKENQKKIIALAAQPGIELSLIMPTVWYEPVLKKIPAYVPAYSNYEVHPTKGWLIGQEQFYIYQSIDLGIRRFQPNVIYVEQGAGALVYSQSLIFRNMYAPKAKAVFFTWWNLTNRPKWPLSQVEKFNLEQSQGAVAGNWDAAKILNDRGLNKPVMVLPQLGIDLCEYTPRDSSQLRRELGLNRFTIGYTGRLVEEKGIRVLLSALVDVEFEFQLLVLGRGPLEDEIRAFAEQHQWGDRLKLVFGIGHSNISKYQNCMDVMVVPSLTRPHWKEQFGHVIIEAMACGVPVVGSNSAEVPNVVGDAGLIVPEGDALALRLALQRLANSAELRTALAKAGRARVKDRYSHDSIAEKLIGFFNSLG